MTPLHALHLGGMEVAEREASASAAHAGLTSTEAAERRRTSGPNAVIERRPNPLWLWLGKLWGPVPWMLEVVLILELTIGRHTQGCIIAALLLLNATISFVQEGRARNALELLKSRLEIQSRVRRDGRWQAIAAVELVPGDFVHVRTGDFVPADLQLVDGVISLDQSTLTGESAPVDVGPGANAMAGAIVRQGEASGVVTATGARTVYGKTAELVHTAHAPSHFQQMVIGLVRYLMIFVGVLVVAVIIDAMVIGLPWLEVVAFALILMVAAVPVALPATYTLAGAVGALELNRRGVLVTRLAAIEDAAAMEVLCSDKTGTLTENRLSFSQVFALPPHSAEEVLRAAALASREATQDPLDLTVLAAAKERGLVDSTAEVLEFAPFDPKTKLSKSVVRRDGGVEWAIKGAPAAVGALMAKPLDVAGPVEALSGQGCRVLAVATGPPDALELLGLAALRDPPRADSAAVVRELHSLGIRVVMVTGDGAETARSIASEVGIVGPICPSNRLHAGAPIPLECDVFAGVYPEDKYRLVEALQRSGRVVGMTGDGVNDAPALRQAEVGVAVAGAVDVAKAAAGMVLTRPGLGEVVEAVRVGREIYRRMLTYTVNKVVKTLQIALVLAGGLLITGVFVTTPRLILLLLFANDFVTMSLAADRVAASPRPNRWDARTIAFTGIAAGCAWLLLTALVFWAGRDLFALSLPQLQTLIFATLVFTGYANVILVRERQHIWASWPGRWLTAAMCGGAAFAACLAAGGFLMAPIPVWMVFALLGLVIAYLLALDALRAWAGRFGMLGISFGGE